MASPPRTRPLIGGQACAPVLLLSQLKSQMVPGGGQGSKDLMPEPQPLWFVCVLEGEINILENPRSHSLMMMCPWGL